MINSAAGTCNCAKGNTTLNAAYCAMAAGKRCDPLVSLYAFQDSKCSSVMAQGVAGATKCLALHYADACAKLWSANFEAPCCTWFKAVEGLVRQGSPETWTEVDLMCTNKVTCAAPPTEKPTETHASGASRVMGNQRLCTATVMLALMLQRVFPSC